VSPAVHRLLHHPKLLGAAGVALLIGVGLVTKSTLEVRHARAETTRAIAATESEILELEARVERERVEREAKIRFDRGHGPGGIRSPHEDLLFDGPTAARSALELVLAAERAGYEHLRYTAEAPRALAVFPPEVDSEMTDEAPSRGPIKDRIDFVEWPIRLTVESDWSSIVDLVSRLTTARPAFAIRTLDVQVLRDGQGNVIDRLALDAELSTFWLQAEGGS
jgi:hypothetical protein